MSLGKLMSLDVIDYIGTSIAIMSKLPNKRRYKSLGNTQ